MSFVYHRPYLVKNWSIISDKVSEKQVKIIKRWFEEAGAYLLEWPLNSYKDFVLDFKNKGYTEVFEEGQEFYTLPEGLLIRSCNEYVKTFNENTNLIFTGVEHRVGLKIHSESDYGRIFNTILSQQPPVTLSQLFKIWELCHDEDGKRYSMFVTQTPVVPQVVGKLSEKVVTIGPEAGSYILVNPNDTKKEILESIENYFLTENNY